MFQVEVLKQALAQDEPGMVTDVLRSFVDTMLEPMIQRYSLFSAKGTTVEMYAHNSDQTMLSHLLNGIFPTLNLVRAVQQHADRPFRDLRETDLRLYILAYSMHDLDKILGRNGLNTRQSLIIAGVYRDVLAELERVNGRAFLPDLDQWVAEITWLAVNTQRSRDINLSDSSFINDDILSQFEGGLRQLGHIKTRLRDLCTFSDLITYTVKSPQDVLVGSAASRFQSLLEALNTDFGFVYHKLADVRGFLTNLVNNATMSYMQGIYGEDQPRLIPFLFFPNGVVYLNPQRLRPAPVIDRAALSRYVRDEVREACEEAVGDGAGFGFSPLGLLKYPGYFHDFLSPQAFLELFAQKTIDFTKENVAISTLEKMREMQTAGRVPASIELDYYPSARVGALGRFLINLQRLLDENLNRATADDLKQKLIARWPDPADWQRADQIPSSGGLDYRYYWLAAQYLKAHPYSEDELKTFLKEIVAEMVEAAGEQLEAAPGLQGPYLSLLPEYLDQNLSFGFTKRPSLSGTGSDWAGELSKYSAAKQPRESKLPCTLCNGAYTTAVQEDASVLFQPWVYKNRLPLYKGSNAGGICSICSLELMLRQILMRDRPGGGGQIRVTGKKYEAQELKYFFIYPAFFFTTQTFRLAYNLIEQMKGLKLFEARSEFSRVDKLTSANILNLSFFNLRPTDISSLQSEEEEEKEQKGTMYLCNRQEKQQYPGFIFFAKKTFSREGGANATTQSWVEAAWLGLALPLVVGSRVVVSELYLPLFNSAADFKETVVLDAPHHALRYLLPGARLRLDELYGSFDERNDRNELGGALGTLSRVIELHIDTEADKGDTRLGRFTRIARELATDQLWVFSFLQEQMRDKKFDSMMPEQTHHYIKIYEQLGGNMERHKKCVELYLKFYNPYEAGKQLKSRAITRPVDLAAERIVTDTLNMDEGEIKLEMRQELQNWIDRVRTGQATGRAVYSKSYDAEMLAIKEFADYFYETVYLGYAEGERAILNSRLNRFKNGCEAAYTDLVRERRLARQQANQPITDDLPDTDTPIENDETTND